MSVTMLHQMHAMAYAVFQEMNYLGDFTICEIDLPDPEVERADAKGEILSEKGLYKVFLSFEIPFPKVSSPHILFSLDSPVRIPPEKRAFIEQLLPHTDLELDEGRFHLDLAYPGIWQLHDVFCFTGDLFEMTDAFRSFVVNRVASMDRTFVMVDQIIGGDRGNRVEHQRPSSRFLASY